MARLEWPSKRQENQQVQTAQASQAAARRLEPSEGRRPQKHPDQIVKVMERYNGGGGGRGGGH